MTTFKKFYRYIAWLIIVLLILVLAGVYPEFQESARRLEGGYNIYRVIFTIISYMIGVLLMLERLVWGLANGLKVMRSGLFFSLALLIMLLTPFLIGVSFTGFGIEYTIMQEGFFRGIIGVCGGVIFVQSITYEGSNQ